MNSSFTGLGWGLIFAVMLVYLLMVVNFQSWLDPLIILMALPGRAGGHPLDALRHPDHRQRSVADGRDHEHRRGDGEQHSDDHVRQRSAQGRLQRARCGLDAGHDAAAPGHHDRAGDDHRHAADVAGLGEGGEQNAPLAAAVIGGLDDGDVRHVVFRPDSLQRIAHEAAASAGREGVAVMEQSTMPMPPAHKRREDADQPPQHDEHNGAQTPAEGQHQEHQGGHDDLPPLDALPRPGRKFFWTALIALPADSRRRFRLGIGAEVVADAEARDRSAGPRQRRAGGKRRDPASIQAVQRTAIARQRQPLQETAIFARTNGYLKKWNVDYGASVKKNDVLAIIDAPDVDEQLREARASLDADEANISKANLDLTYNDTTTHRYEER